MIRAAFLAIGVLLVGCQSRPTVGSELKRRGDEIVVAGRFVHTGAPVVLWIDPGGYDGYRVEKRFAPIAQSDWDHSAGSIETPNRYDSRATDPELVERTRGGNWDIEEVRAAVDQIVLHYDASGTSRQCFKTLHDARGLSIHFMVDLDGTIYQTLDVKERAWHATKSNARSIGIEIANIGAYATVDSTPLSRWYGVDERGLFVTLPPGTGNGGVRTPDFVARPRCPDFVRGPIHGEMFVQADFTPEQYRSLSHLLAALHASLPSIPLTCPRDASGDPLSRCLSADEWREFRGVLGHYHIQENKIDPGPALDWNSLLCGSKSAVGVPASLAQ